MQICRGFKEHARPNHMLVESSSRRFPRELGPVRMELRGGDLPRLVGVTNLSIQLISLYFLIAFTCEVGYLT